jgi:hypothetical protein
MWWCREANCFIWYFGSDGSVLLFDSSVQRRVLSEGSRTCSAATFYLAFRFLFGRLSIGHSSRYHATAVQPFLLANLNAAFVS